MLLRLRLGLWLVALLALGSSVVAGPQWPGQTVRASVPSGGGQGNRASGEPTLSGDGRYLAFASLASNLVAGDTNGTWDVFVHDRQTSQTSLVSVGPQGVPANGWSGQPAISADARYVAFASLASNLVAGDTNGTWDIFVHDLASGQTERVSVASDGTEAKAGTFSEDPAISADGRYVAFTSTTATLVAGDTNGVDDVFVHDRTTRTTWRVSVGPGGTEADGWSYNPALSADGRMVAFTSIASTLVAGDTNGIDDVFVHDRQTGETRRVSVGPGGSEADDWSYYPVLSADGGHVSFVSQATNLVTGDGNGLADVFVYDAQSGAVSRVSVAAGGGEANGWSDHPSLSSDGRYIAFFSAASNFTSAPTSGIGEIFVHDRRSGETRLVSVSSAGTGADSWSDQPALSADGRFVTFRSEAANLVTDDTNGWADVFVVGGVSVTPRTDTFAGSGGTSVVDVTFVYDGSAWSAASLDPWIAILDQSATIGSGTVSFRVAVNDGAARTGTIVVAAQPVTITQAERTAPMAHDGTVTTNEDVPAAGQLAATDPNGDPLAFAIVSNGVLGTAAITDAATGAFVYTPAPNASGTDSFTFGANDGTTGSNVATVTVTITEVNDAPVALADAVETAEDVTVTGSLPWTDVDGPTSALRVVTNGILGTATITNAATGAFTYVPNPHVFGTDVFTFIASDGAAESNVGTVAVMITPVNDAPVAVDGALTIDEDSAGTGRLTALDVDGPASTFTIVTNGRHGVAAITDPIAGTFAYEPQSNVFGTDTFTFVVHDGSAGSNVGTVTVTIAAVNDAPVAQTGFVTTTAGMASEGLLRASDPDPDALTFRIVEAPKLGAVSVDAATGAFRYEPAPEASGADTFTFQVEDAAGASSTASEQVIIVSGAPQWPGQTVRASVASGGGQGNRASGEPALSADGRYVAFASQASSLVAGDTNGTWDVFVHDRQTGQTSRASVGLESAQGNGWSGQPAVSADGRYVAFASQASNLVAADTNGSWDIFVHDRTSGQTARVSVASDGTEAEAGAFSENPAISADGRYVAFTSTATTLVAGDANGVDDVFVHDRVTTTTWRASVGRDGTEADGWSYQPALSADGRLVAFTSVASNLVAGDSNGIDDVFVHDRQTGETRRVSVGPDGSDANDWSNEPTLSADGRYLGFVSQATNLVAGDGNGLADVFVYDAQSRAVSRVSVPTGGGEANGWSDQPALSADGRYIAFFSAASNLTSGMNRGAWEVVVHDRRTGETRRVSMSGTGTPANGWSDQPALSADGRFVAFRSSGSNLVAGDTNGRSDVFVVGGVSVAPATQTFAARGGVGEVVTAFVYQGTTWRAVSHVPWIMIAGQSSTQGSGSVNYSIASNAGGARIGTMTVAGHTITITQGENHAPQVQDSRIGTLKNMPVGGQLTALDPDGDSLTYSIVRNGTLGTATMTDGATGTFTYTPHLDSFGIDTFTFKASDGIAESAVATITVDIAGSVNRNPVANPDSVTTTVNSAVTIDVLANDTDPDGDALTIASITQPANGTATIQGSSVSFAPAANFSGATSFSYTVSDGHGGTGTAVVSVDVTPSALPALRLNEIIFRPVSGEPQFIEVKNVGSGSAVLSEFSFRTQQGNAYRMPDGINLPRGAIALILFDGQNRIDGFTIHADISTFLDPDEGALDLTDSSGALVDRIAWGESQPFSVTLGHGGLVAETEIVPGTSIGRSPLSTTVGPLEWEIFPPAEVTPGAANPNPPVRIPLPLSGAVFSPGPMQLDWYPSVGATRYRVQLASDETFTVLVADAVVETPSFTSAPLSQGTYFWRVQAIAKDDSTAEFSDPNVLIIENTPIATEAAHVVTASLPQSRVLAVPRISQHKDTQLLLLESPNAFGPHAWNVDHQVTDLNDPANWTCAAASIAMVNAFYGGRLSQDRINFEALRDVSPGPEGDLVYSWFGISVNQFQRALTFALGAAPQGRVVQSAAQIEEFWDTIKSEIDAGRPLIVTHITLSYVHNLVITGYQEEDGNRRYGVNDPLAPGQAMAKRYAIDIDKDTARGFDAKKLIVLVWKLPATVTPASDEPEITLDSDGDGVMDFDETQRFKTDPNKEDSDNDRVEDYSDIFASIFDEKYGYALNPVIGIAFRDFDRDGLPMERDKDSDGDGCSDGFEDKNLNGVYEPQEGETYNFDDRDGLCRWAGTINTEIRSSTAFGTQTVHVHADVAFELDESTGVLPVTAGSVTIHSVLNSINRDPPCQTTFSGAALIKPGDGTLGFSFLEFPGFPPPPQYQVYGYTQFTSTGTTTCNDSNTPSEFVDYGGAAWAGSGLRHKPEGDIIDDTVTTTLYTDTIIQRIRLHRVSP